MAVIRAGKGVIQQCSCDHWECPVCGDIRAKQEYRRIVYGAEILALKNSLYFVTLTCRGREIELDEAEREYYTWTNRLLTAYRTHVSRAGGYWAYVQVTERQKKTRNHPHSHILVTAIPNDAVWTKGTDERKQVVSALFSRWNETSGLGSQHKISQVASAGAVARYVAKYLFKSSSRDKFPPKWKRIRYSRNYPKPQNPEYDVAYVLTDADQWEGISQMKVEWSTNIPLISEWLQRRFPYMVLNS